MRLGSLHPIILAVLIAAGTAGRSSAATITVVVVDLKDAGRSNIQVNFLRLLDENNNLLRLNPGDFDVRAVTGQVVIRVNNPAIRAASVRVTADGAETTDLQLLFNRDNIQNGVNAGDQTIKVGLPDALAFCELPLCCSAPTAHRKHHLFGRLFSR